MGFSIAEIIACQLAPQHKLSSSWWLWWKLLRALRVRGRGRSRESGAFLLGTRREQGPARIQDFVLYDDLDPSCLDKGYVHFDGRYFRDLWQRCRDLNLSVVADVHVHPGAEYQSQSDRANPMIPTAGHIALILPNYASPPMNSADVGIYQYLGGKQWTTIEPDLRKTFLHIGV